MASEFNLYLDAERQSIDNPHILENVDETTRASNRRKSVASLLRTVALMLEQGRDCENIKDHNGNRVGNYTLRHF